jgi:hypothetical protein
MVESSSLLPLTPTQIPVMGAICRTTRQGLREAERLRAFWVGASTVSA